MSSVGVAKYCRATAFDDLVQRYASDLPAFAREVCELEHLDGKFLELAAQPDARLAAYNVCDSMPREHAVLALHNLLCNPGSITMVVVNHIAHAEREVWGELRRIIHRLSASPLAWRDLRLVMKTRSLEVRMPGAGYGKIRLVTGREPETLAGLHCTPDSKLLWLMPEAGGTPEHAFSVIAASHGPAPQRWAITYQTMPDWFMPKVLKAAQWWERSDAPPSWERSFHPRGFTFIDVTRTPLINNWGRALGLYRARVGKAAV